MLLKLYLIVVLIQLTTCTRILIVSPAASLSHNLFYRPIVEELSIRGHQVTIIAGDTFNNPELTNLTEINVHDETYGVVNSGDLLLNHQLNKLTTMEFIKSYSPLVVPVLRNILKNIQVQEVLKNGEFDLVMVEHLNFPVLFGLKEHFKCPLIGMISFELTMTGHDTVGNPTFPSYTADFGGYAGADLTFWERLDNFLYALEARRYHYWEIIPEHEVLAEEIFGKQMDLVKAERSVDLILVNSNPIFHEPKPNVPAIVEIGGLHSRKSQFLSPELKKYLDDAKEGVVYFSLGSNVKSKSLPKEVFDGIVEAFAQLPYRVLWKWEATDIPNKPSNVLLQKWLPQQDVLDHPNVKVFVTQGGIQSIEESIQTKTPMLCIPFGGDQEYNAGRIEKLKIGKRLNYEDLNRVTLVDRLKEIVQNPLYQERVNKVSDLLYDQPMKPLDRAIWWIEYIIRHGGGEHLRSPGVDMSWFKLLSLDVIAFLLGCAITVIFIVIYFIKFLLSFVKPKKTKQPKSNKKKQKAH